jgi:hypothetical protein
MAAVQGGMGVLTDEDCEVLHQAGTEGKRALELIDAQAAEIERLKAAAEEMRKHALSEAGHAIRAEDKWSASKQLLGWVRSLHECDESERSQRILEAIDALDQQQRPVETSG